MKIILKIKLNFKDYLMIIKFQYYQMKILKLIHKLSNEDNIEIISDINNSIDKITIKIISYILIISI